MARTWLSIRVELIEGHGEHLWPRPGRIFAAARSHTFSDLADAIDDAFARWDRSHLQEFNLADGSRLCDPDPDWQVEGQIEEDYRRVRLSRLRPGEQLAYVFDLGDDWAHLCTVGDGKIDPVEVLGIRPDRPLPYWGWGEIPDQYRRRWDRDDGESAIPPDPALADLPPLRPLWGPGGSHPGPTARLAVGVGRRERRFGGH
jgi:Plasmid pRiA4b ORF-3-like protein